MKTLLNTVPKEVHGLVYSDICPDDRQNYNSLKKVMEPKVREALAKHVVDSEGTIEYIKICHEVTSSLNEEDLEPLERIFRIQRSKFFLRAWRWFIVQNEEGNMKLNDNFISSNAYTCIELNAQNLIILAKKFRDEGLGNLFVPTIFNSQPCEETFRKMRSMGTLNYTKINFTLLELMHLVSRVELMNDIMYFKLADVDVIFPRNPLSKATENKFELPSDSDIQNTIAKALSAAINDAKRFGINVQENDIKDCDLKNDTLVFDDIEQNSNDDLIDLGIASDSNDVMENDFKTFKDYSNTNASPDENSSFLNVSTTSGGKTIRKSSLIWSLSVSKDKLSSDRLRRVRHSSNKKKSNRQLEFIDASIVNQPIFKGNELKIGDWCIFKGNDDGNFTYSIGSILSIRYVDGRTNTEKKYSWDFAPTTSNENGRELEILASWYKMEINESTPTFSHTKKVFINMRCYIATLSHDLIVKTDDVIHFTKNSSKSILNVLKKFQ